MAIRIITDSTSDFTRAEAAQLGLEIVPLKTRFDIPEGILREAHRGRRAAHNEPALPIGV